MSKIWITFVILLSWDCQISDAESELSAKLVYELLSARIDNVVRENSFLKYELSETKAVVERLEENIDRIASNVSEIANKVDKIEAANSEPVLNEKFKAIEDLSVSTLQRKFKAESVLLRKMLVNEKSHMRETILAFEQKFKTLQSELDYKLDFINSSIETAVDTLEHSMSEQNITTIRGLEAVADNFRHQLNGTDFFIHEMNINFENRLLDSGAKLKKVETEFSGNISNLDQRLSEQDSRIQTLNVSFENKLTDFDAISKQGDKKLVENINAVDQRLTSAKSSLQSSYNDINNRLYNAESKLRSLSSKQDRQENTFSNQISDLSARIYKEEARKVAFSAKLNKKQTYYGKDERIVFDAVIYSYGGGYSSSTGIFTAPKSGTYLFAYNIESTTSGNAHVVLMIDGKLSTRALVRKGSYNNGGNTGIAYIYKGDKVWVETASILDKYYISPYRTTFNGILID